MNHSQTADPLAAALEAQAPFLMRLARAILADEHAAEDLVQDTLASALKASNGSRGWGDGECLNASNPKGVRAWLIAALRRRSIDGFRVSRSRALDGSKPLNDLVGQAATPEEIAIRLERQQLLHNALLAIPDKNRTALVLRYQDGLALKAIASAVDAPVTTVKSRLKRGLELVKQELARVEDQDEDGRARWLGAITALAGDLRTDPVGAASVTGGAGAMHSAATSLGGIGLFQFGILLLAIVTMAVFGFWVKPWSVSESSEEVAGDVAALEKLAERGDPSSIAWSASEVTAPFDNGRRLAADESVGEVSKEVVAGQVVPQKLVGRVVCSMTGEAVVAHLQLGETRPQAASFAEGDFLLKVTAGEMTPLRVSHPGYETLELTAEMMEGLVAEGDVLDLGVLELVPSDRVELMVLDGNGVPVAGAKCTLHRRLYREMEGRGPGPTALDVGRPLGFTDQNGRLHFPLASSAAVVVQDSEGRLGVSVVASGQDNQIRIEGPARRMVMRYAATHEPVVGRVFPIGWQQGAVETGLFVQTDEFGHVDLPTGAGTLSLCKSEPRLLLDALRVGKQSVQSVEQGDFKATCTLSAKDTEILVDVSNHEVPLHLLDADTGARLTGIAYCQTELSWRGGPWKGGTAKASYPIESGTMLAHSWFTGPHRGDGDSRRRRWIATAGYVPKFIEGGDDLRGAELSMEPCESRSLLILDALDRPLATMVRIQLGSGITIGVDTGASGLAGPFPWAEGEDWVVWAGGLRMDAKRVIEAAVLKERSVVSVRPASGSGAIQVLGVPAESPPLFALTEYAGYPVQREELTEPLSLDRESTEPTRTVWIDGLSPGDYAIGPKVWVSQLVSRAQNQGRLSGAREAAEQELTPLLLRVEAGETVRVDWNPGWFDMEPLTGKVSCEGVSGQDLAVLPVFERTGTNVYFGTSTPWRFCDRQGRFSTRAGDPRPVAFLIARFDYGVFGRRPIVLDSQLVREDGLYRVSLTSFELVASNAEDWANSNVSSKLHPTLKLIGDSEVLNAPMKFLHGAKGQTWNPTEPIRMNQLPGHIASLHLNFPKPNPDQDVAIHPGTDTRVEIYVPLPTAKVQGSSGKAGMRSSR